MFSAYIWQISASVLIERLNRPNSARKRAVNLSPQSVSVESVRYHIRPDFVHVGCCWRSSSIIGHAKYRPLDAHIDFKRDYVSLFAIRCVCSLLRRKNSKCTNTVSSRRTPSSVCGCTRRHTHVFDTACRLCRKANCRYRLPRP